jgi:hypothetical protein
MLLELEQFDYNIWECCAGLLHLSNEMTLLSKKVRSSDLYVRCEGIEQLDFIGIDNTGIWEGDIITNPPYRYANEFILKALSILKYGKKLALFLPIRYLEGKYRAEIFKKFPPYKIYVSSSRIKCAINGNFDDMKGSAVCYCWMVWINGYKGESILRLFN